MGYHSVLKKEEQGQVALQVQFAVKQDVLIIRLKGELDHHTAEQLRTEAEQKISESEIKHLLFNLEGLSFMDSSGLGVMLGRYKQISQWGGRMIVCAISPSIYRLFELSGMFKIIQLAETEEEALETLGVA